jgi:hypothetical protein
MNLDKYLKKGRLNEARGTSYLNDYTDTEVLPFIKGKKIAGWEFDYEGMTGGWSWSSKKSEWVVYATPYWENAAGISLAKVNAEGDYQDFDTVIAYSVSGDPKKDAAEYLKAMKKVLSRA